MEFADTILLETRVNEYADPNLEKMYSDCTILIVLVPIELAICSNTTVYYLVYEPPCIQFQLDYWVYLDYIRSVLINIYAIFN